MHGSSIFFSLCFLSLHFHLFVFSPLCHIHPFLNPCVGFVPFSLFFRSALPPSFSRSLPRVPGCLSLSRCCLRSASPIGCFYGYLNQCQCVIGGTGQDWATLEVWACGGRKTNGSSDQWVRGVSAWGGRQGQSAAAVCSLSSWMEVKYLKSKCNTHIGTLDHCLDFIPSIVILESCVLHTAIWESSHMYA